MAKLNFECVWAHFCIWGHLKDFSWIERDKERQWHIRAHAGGKLTLIFICLTDAQQGPFKIHYALLPVMLPFYRHAGEYNMLFHIYRRM